MMWAHHELIAEALEARGRQGLGKKVGEVVLGPDVVDANKPAVPNGGDPALATIDVLQLGALNGAVGKALGGRIVNEKL